ncbi:MAG: hypothetical protein KGR16_00435 [Verrucomicrobia bacterium]|nr:hypothetical protein [Verrucomicrobiota bacterium]MDE3048142.1 hypothetical protein [Verrucomicrobiota bacterium]
MREWVDEISDYMQQRESVPEPLIELSEEYHQAVLETEIFFEAADELQSAITSIVGKIEHANS